MSPHSTGRLQLLWVAAAKRQQVWAVLITLQDTRLPIPQSSTGIPSPRPRDTMSRLAEPGALQVLRATCYEGTSLNDRCC